MSSQASKFKIGIFVVSALLIFVSVFVWLGASRYFEDSQTVVAYFTESVQGLESDSPVKYRGVPIGRVKSIQMAPDARLIEVRMNLNRNFKINDDLGVKINLLGLTGQKYLEMDNFRPDQVREPIVLDFTPRYPVIPTYPSDIREIGNALENIFQKVKGVDLERVTNNLIRISGRLDKMLSDSQIDNTFVDVAEAVKEIKEVGRKLNDDISRNQPIKAMTKTFEKANEFLQSGSEAARSIDRMVRRSDNNINLLTQKLDRSADNLIDFTRMIKLKPSSIIFGPGDKSGDGR
ncbi:MAG: MlaD family protein [Syntrophaceae bacterium]|nr:MlaD family protein [Syntrophaceae bacterium]